MSDDGFDYDSGPDELDKLYDEMDNLVDLVNKRGKAGASCDTKYYTSFQIITLMMEEAPETDINIYRQTGKSWVAEVKYKGMQFVHVVGKNIPEEWQEFV